MSDVEEFFDESDIISKPKGELGKDLIKIDEILRGLISVKNSEMTNKIYQCSLMRNQICIKLVENCISSFANDENFDLEFAMRLDKAG